MFQIHTIQNFDTDQTYIKELCSKICKLLPSITPRHQDGLINIVGLSTMEIQNLNKTYRKKDYATDILTFPYFEDFRLCQQDETAGEILICTDVIQDQAKEKQITYQKELKILLVHGMVHML